MIDIALHDANFEGQPGVSPYISPTKLRWVRDGAEKVTTVAVFTDHKLNATSYARRKIAWLVESPEVVPQIYDQDDGFYGRFETVLTFKRTLLDRGGKFLWMPFGSTHLRAEDIEPADAAKATPKTKALSMIASKKLFTGGHKLRCDIADAASGTWAEDGIVVDLFGKGREHQLQWKVDGLRPYMFSLAIENCAIDWYFSEKLIDCFLTRTVPVYYGCPGIGKFFNTDGMLFVDSVEHAKRVCDAVQDNAEGMYESMRDAIEENYKRALEFVTPEDIIATVYV